jgi:hypothetical protein
MGTCIGGAGDARPGDAKTLLRAHDQRDHVKVTQAELDEALADCLVRHYPGGPFPDQLGHLSQ